MRIKSLALGFLTGSAAAIITALLAAPASGKDTRKTLSENKELILTELKDLKLSLGKIKDSLSSVSKEGKTTIYDFIQDVKLAVNEWKLDTEENKTEITKELQEIEQAIEELEKNLTHDSKK